MLILDLLLTFLRKILFMELFLVLLETIFLIVSWSDAIISIWHFFQAISRHDRLEYWNLWSILLFIKGVYDSPWKACKNWKFLYRLMVLQIAKSRRFCSLTQVFKGRLQWKSILKCPEFGHSDISWQERVVWTFGVMKASSSGYRGMFYDIIETCKKWFSFTGSWHDVEL